MKSFYKKLFLTALPLLACGIIIAMVDPYYLFHKDRSFNEKKYEIGYSFDQGRRYKIFTYLNNPTSKIILGASEINVINERNIPEDGWHSLSFGGAPLQESINLFWEITRKFDVREVILAPEFIKYFNAISTGSGDEYYTNYNWATSQSYNSLSIYDNKFDYFLDRYTLKSTFEYVCDEILATNDRSRPQMSKDEFWKNQLDYANKVYGGNVVSEKKKNQILDEFRRVKQFSVDNNIDVKIVVPVQHTDLLKLEFSDRVLPIYKEYIYELVATFGKIYYFAYTDNISPIDSMFSDPFHYLEADLYIDNIFNNDSSYFVLNGDNLEHNFHLIDQKLKKQ